MEQLIHSTQLSSNYVHFLNMDVVWLQIDFSRGHQSSLLRRTGNNVLYIEEKT